MRTIIYKKKSFYKINRKHVGTTKKYENGKNKVN